MFDLLSNCLYCCGLRLIARDTRNVDSDQNRMKFAVVMDRPQCVMQLFSKYPQICQNYCFCLHRNSNKVEPMTTADPIDAYKNSATSNGANTTPIIPIAIDTNVYVLEFHIFTLCPWSNWIFFRRGKFTIEFQCVGNDRVHFATWNYRLALIAAWDERLSHVSMHSHKFYVIFFSLSPSIRLPIKRLSLSLRQSVHLIEIISIANHSSVSVSIEFSCPWLLSCIFCGVACACACAADVTGESAFSKRDFLFGIL